MHIHLQSPDLCCHQSWQTFSNQLCCHTGRRADVVQGFEFVAAVPAAPEMVDFFIVLILRLNRSYRLLSTREAVCGMSKKGDRCHFHLLFFFFSL
jgi:hypothetical protein